MKMLIVESRAKARTIEKYVGRDWIVLATGGHVQDLPERGQAYWANRPGRLPAPPWGWTENGEQAVAAIRAAAQRDGVTRFFLAPDPDREGEFIAWRLSELLSDLAPCLRVTFQEVTRPALETAIASPRPIDMALVESAMVRRFLDRLVGFRASKIARKFVTRRTASMGRVQTPTLGFVVERERKRRKHVPKTYFEVQVTVEGLDLRVRFHEADDPQRWVDDSGRHDPGRTADPALARQCLAALGVARAITVSEVKESQRLEAPPPAFTTDALLQAAGGRWGWSPKKTSKLATDLYEAGHISYIRTDSTRLAGEAIEEACAVVVKSFGPGSLGRGPAASAPRGRIQDAHEAIRPTRFALTALPGVEADAQRLYDLIRAQVLASQMASARRATWRIAAGAEGLSRPLTGAVSWYVDLGWRAAFRDFDERDTARPNSALRPGARVPLLPATGERASPLLVEGQTEPPPRYRAHTLIKAMKEGGIGRPSTYASTVETLLERGYVVEEDRALVPTVDGKNVWRKAASLYELPGGERLFDVAYTAAMETRLDKIAAGVEAACVVWETLRDEVRAAHEGAGEVIRAGQATPRQREVLEALLINAPEAREEVGPVEALTAKDAAAWIDRLRARGVEPAPSARQVAAIQRLCASAGLSEAEAAALAGLPEGTAIRTRGEASAVIKALHARVAERRMPTERQLRHVADLARKLGLSEAEACARVGSRRFDELTGGRTGTMSELISILKAEARARRGRDEAAAGRDGPTAMEGPRAR